jgi:TRAP-type mannitol/chloroaromatic compound transport system permease small subunit
MTALLRLADAIDGFVKATDKFASAVILIIVALLSWNVASRYLGGGASVALQEAE